jgi:foldase protein PrsA
MDGSLHLRRRITAPLLAALVTLTAAGPAAARQPPVTVNDPAGAVTVGEAELEHWVEIARRSAGGIDRTTPKRQLQAQALQLLISFAWIDGEARAQGITVTEAETEASFEEQKRLSFPKDSDYRRFLRSSGQTEADLFHRVRLDLVSNAIRDKVVAPAAGSVTEADIDAYVAEHGRTEVPEQRDVRIVLTATRALALQARGALERGANWKEVARRYSIERASARHGGRLGLQMKGMLPKRLDRAVFRARQGRLVGPLKTRDGYYVFSVGHIQPATLLPEKTQRRLVRDQLESDAQQELLDAFVTGFTATWRARTVCAPRFDWIRDCGNWDGTEVKP